MEKTFHYSSQFMRQNFLKRFIYATFYSICSYPRLLIEVFIRRNMGERYFSLVYCITAAVVLGGIPFLWPSLRLFGTVFILTRFWSWYAFLTAFLVFSGKRHLEVKHKPGVFQLAKYSKSRGEDSPFFDRFFIFFKTTNLRLLDIVFEPMMPFAAGLFLLLIGQTPLGWLLVGCSIIYSLSMAAGYYYGDQMVMDILDKIILNEERAESFRTNTPPKRGVGFHPDLPDLQSLREDIFTEMEENDIVF